MRTRLIAALLLVALSGLTQAFALSEMHSAHPAAAAKASHAHSCCPKLNGSHVYPAVAPAVPASLPCGDQHSCCFGRDSNHPVILTATSGTKPPLSRIAAFEAIETNAGRGFALVRSRSAAGPDSYSKLSTILRN